MMTDQISAILVVAILAGLAVFQLLLVAGKPLGRFAWGGQHEVLPRNLRLGSCVSVLIYAFIAYVVLAKAGLVDAALSKSFIDTAVWVLVVYFASGILMNGISRSRPERFTMTPIAALLTLGCLLLVV